MTTTERETKSDARRDMVALAREIGQGIGGHAARHDAEGSFVEEAYEALRAAGALALGVPTELGGGGATISEVAAFQRELAHHDGATALASAMHQHVVAFTAWRHRRQMPGAEATLRRVAEEGIVLVSTGGADFTRPRGRAEKVEGGYLVSGTKVFASSVPMGSVLATMFPYEDPEQGLRVLNMAVPLASDGVVVLDNWDTLGMRGTGSNDVVLEEVFVPDERVLGNRPHGVIDPPLLVIGSIAMPIISAVYLGVAEAAYEAALAAAGARGASPTVQRQVGLMTTRLRVAAWALEGALAQVGDDPEPDVATFAAAMAAKREIALAGVEVCDVAMEVGGGAAFFKGSLIERCYRDVRAAKFHPLTPEDTLVHAGRLALGLPVEEF
jgi:alkylation response protein AidB-like acyl-CoA dehydrogenase